VRCEQKLGVLATYLLEPESGDGLATWNFLDTDLKIGEDYPIVRIEKPAAITTIEAAPLPPRSGANEPPKPITFEEAYESDHAPNLNGSPVGRLAWVDGEHFVQMKDGKAMTVEAATGRAVPRFDAEKTAQIVESLRALPTIDKRTAESIASRSGLTTDKAGNVAVFEPH